MLTEKQRFEITSDADPASQLVHSPLTPEERAVILKAAGDRYLFEKYLARLELSAHVARGALDESVGEAALAEIKCEIDARREALGLPVDIPEPER